jgi:hypothetical protein
MPIDSAAVLPDGTQVSGRSGLQNILLARKDPFADAFTERLMIYALGRGIEPTDMPEVRKIRRQAAAKGYHIQDIILGIAQSVPFQNRSTPKSSMRMAQK